MSDLISREEAIKALGDIHPLDYNARAYKSKIESIPSADIIDHAKAIKEYCERFPECEGCRFYKGLPFRCTFGICPQEWNLPTPWADNNIFEKGGNDDNI